MEKSDSVRITVTVQVGDEEFTAEINPRMDSSSLRSRMRRAYNPAEMLVFLAKEGSKSS